MRELHWGATPVSSRIFAPVATPEPATLEAKLTMPGGDGGADEAIQAATAQSTVADKIRCSSIEV